MATSNQCQRCQNYLGRSCFAFWPKKIPDAIMEGRKDHRKPFPGDKGIRWERVSFVAVRTQLVNEGKLSPE